MLKDNSYRRVLNVLTADQGPVPAALIALTLHEYETREPSRGLTLTDLAVRPELPNVTIEKSGKVEI